MEFVKKHTKLVGILGLLALFVGLGLRTPLQITEYQYQSQRVPAAFDGFRLVQISDFHCKDFGDRETTLIQAVRTARPDVILLTGDMIDSLHTTENAAYLLKGIAEIAPIYSVTGNHEFDDLGLLSELESLYKRYGVVELDETTTRIFIGADSITLSGMGSIYYGPQDNREGHQVPSANTKYFNILLNHYSNHFDQIAPLGYDLVFSGHTHGGIIRLPFIGGILGNDGTFFPKYQSGLYTVGTSTLVSSRGLGNAEIPRFYNAPELVCVTLHAS